MKAIRNQGLAFCATAIAVSGYCVLFSYPTGQGMLAVLALLIVMLGIPHGALDAMLAAGTFRIRGPLPWALFLGSYLALVLLVMAAWRQWPLPMLALFLVVSAAHFSGDPEDSCPGWIRLLYGGAPVVLPFLRHDEELFALFSFLAPAGDASRLVAALDPLAWPWLVALSLGIAVHWRRHRQGASEIAALATLTIVAPPLLSFTVFFCGMHSARHILRCLHRDGHHPGESASTPRQTSGFLGPSGRQAALTAFPPMVATLLLLSLYWANATELALEPRIIQTVFVGLAALTLPHVILVDGMHRLRSSEHSSAATESMPHHSCSP